MKAMRGLAAALVLAACVPAGAARVLILLAEGFNGGEFWDPYAALTNAGHRVDVAAPAAGPVLVSPEKGPQPGKDATANLALADAKDADYAALVIPGGYSPGNLEKHPEALDLCRRFMAAGKPVAAICHGPRLLLRAGLLKGRTFTCLSGVADELADEWTRGDAFARYLDLPVVRDGNLLTSRYPGDLATFNAALLHALGSAPEPAWPSVPAALPADVPLRFKRAVIAPRKGADADVITLVTRAAAAKGVEVVTDPDGAAACGPGTLVVAPGGPWPEQREARQAVQPAWIAEQAAADRRREAWLLAQYDAGATLLLVGLDSLRLGRLERFKGLKFAATDQAVWSFGKTGGSYAGDAARLTAERLVTTKGATTLAEALMLLATEAGGETTW